MCRSPSVIQSTKYVTISAKKTPYIVCTSMHINLKKQFFFCEITHATVQGLMNSEGSLKSTKPMHHLTHLAMESLKIVVLFP